jgi:hypothetical protein
MSLDDFALYVQYVEARIAADQQTVDDLRAQGS